MNRMKKILQGSALLAALVGFLVGPAVADVFVTVDITKFKDISITETITKNKFVDIQVFAFIEPNSAAESTAIKNQLNEENSVFQDSGANDSGDMIDDQLTARIVNSINGNTGVTQFNQDVGNMVNQANVFSIAVVDPAEADTAFTQSQAHQEQINTFNSVDATGRLGIGPGPDFEILSPDKQAGINNSISGNVGVTQVNQNTGNMNNQDNNLSIALGLSDSAVVALSEADLGQFNTSNTVTEVNTIKRDVINGSVNFNAGVTMVNQGSGNMNNQDSSVSFAAITGPAAAAQLSPLLTAF